MTPLSDIIDKIKTFYGDKIIEQHDFRGDLTFTVPKDYILEFFKFLRDDPALAFNFLMDITAVDYL